MPNMNTCPRHKLAPATRRLGAPPSPKVIFSNLFKISIKLPIDSPGDKGLDTKYSSNLCSYTF